MLDVLYTNGVIAAREKYLLKDKIAKLCETDAEEALRQLMDGGFGKGAEVNSPYEYETLVEADEKSIDEFIREYAPSQAEAVYLLAPEGLLPVATIQESIREEKYDLLGEELGGAVKAAAALFAEENSGVSGAEVGCIFEKALYAYLSKGCAKNGILKKLVAAKADMTNILTALRTSDEEYARKRYLGGGVLREEQLAKLFADDAEKASHALDGTPYAEFVSTCFEEKLGGKPLTQAERLLESYDTAYFTAKKYELVKNQPFLYYVFRRRAENENVRILFVCLLAGMKEGDIKKRLRAFE